MGKNFVGDGKDNDEFTDNLVEAGYVKTKSVEMVFRAVDRRKYFLPKSKQEAYQDKAWKDGTLHLSSPCIYSEVVENLKLERGMSFLNLGSGTGYLNTLVGLLIGEKGVNHGVEIHESNVKYATERLQSFLRESPASRIDFAQPKFLVGNVLKLGKGFFDRYDRIYVGAACDDNDRVVNFAKFLKIGGCVIVPHNNNLVKLTKIKVAEFTRQNLLGVSFAPLIEPLGSDNIIEGFPSVPERTIVPVPVPNDDENDGLKVIPFNEITLDKKLGSGAFGTVYLSKWIGTRCAVKQIVATDIIAGAERDRILQEARTHNRLVHPHIVQFIGISLERTSLYIVLKCIDGFNLEEIIFKDKMKLNDKEKNAIAIQVCDVIRYMHFGAKPKVIHQDIKPSNVMIESATKEALVTDFGISRMSGHSEVDMMTSLTNAYSPNLGGTLMYMAPELVIANSEGLCHKSTFQSDIYALGGTMAELFSYRKLYGDNVKDVTTLFAQKLKDETPFAVAYAPSQYQAMLKRSLLKDPKLRPTALEMVKVFMEGNLIK